MKCFPLRDWLRQARNVGVLLFLVADLGGRVLAGAPTPVDGGFTLAVLPDTQNYSWKFPDTYLAQTRWIAQNVTKYQIKYVLHLGDVTQNNTNEEWQVAARAHALLAGLVPFAGGPGNHDLGLQGKSTNRQSAFSEFFPLATFQKWPSFGGVYDGEPAKTENSCHLFEAGGRKWLILALEFGPRDDVLRWASEMVSKYPDRSAILVTHAYLRPDNTRFDRKAVLPPGKGKKQPRNKGLDNYPVAKSPEGFNDGEDMWQKLVSRHPNFALVVCGHVCLTGRLDSTGTHGNVVHQMVVDYQNQPDGGQGYLRLLQFHPGDGRVTVNDYSPVLDQLSSQPNTSYEFKIAPSPAVIP
jgi:hypothetical protein